MLQIQSCVAQFERNGQRHKPLAGSKRSQISLYKHIEMVPAAAQSCGNIATPVEATATQFETDFFLAYKRYGQNLLGFFIVLVNHPRGS